MNHDEHSGGRSLLRSLFSLILIGFLAVAAFLLIAEHRAHIFAGNWVLGLLLFACIGMHFLHGGHGGKSGDHDHGERPSKSGKGGAR